MRLLSLMLCLTLMTYATERKQIFPSSAKPAGPYSPGLMVGDYLYVSGQGARDASGQLSPTVEGQTKQCLENVKAIVEAAGLTMDHVVFTHTYLADMKNYDAMNRVYATYFGSVLPARATFGTARMPTDTPVEISAIAIRDAKQKKTVELPGSTSPVPLSPGMLTQDRFYLSGILGRDSAKGETPAGMDAQMNMAVDRARRVLGAAGLSFDHMVSLIVYRTAAMPASLVLESLQKLFPKGNAPAISMIEVDRLAFDTNIGLHGVAVRDKAQKKVFVASKGAIFPQTVCAAAGDTVYCAAQQPAAKEGGVEDQVKQVMERLSSALKLAGTDLSHAVANNVYLDPMSSFAQMNGVYATHFPTPAPTRTTVQPAADGRQPGHTLIGIVAVR